MKAKQCETKKRSIHVIDFIIVILIITLSVLLIIGYNFFKGEVTREIMAYGLLGLFVLVFLLDFIPQIISSHFAIIAGASSGLDINLVVLFSVIGTILGSMLGFKVGRKQGLCFIYYHFKEKTVKRVFGFWKKYGHMFVMLSALTPLPYFPVIFGSLEMSKEDFIKYGLIPRIVSFVLIGYGVYFGLFGRGL